MDDSDTGRKVSLDSLERTSRHFAPNAISDSRSEIDLEEQVGHAKQFIADDNERDRSEETWDYFPKPDNNESSRNSGKDVYSFQHPSKNNKEQEMSDFSNREMSKRHCTTNRYGSGFKLNANGCESSSSDDNLESVNVNQRYCISDRESISRSSTNRSSRSKSPQYDDMSTSDERQSLIGNRVSSSYERWRLSPDNKPKSYLQSNNTHAADQAINFSQLRSSGDAVNRITNLNGDKEMTSEACNVETHRNLVFGKTISLW